MKKSTIRIIVILMTLSTLGLIAFQLYWIGNAIQINKERFNQDAHAALNAVAEKLEKQEALQIAESKLTHAPLSATGDRMNAGNRYSADLRNFFIRQFDSLSADLKSLYEEPYDDLTFEPEQARPREKNPVRQPLDVFSLHRKIDSIMISQFNAGAIFPDFRAIDSLIFEDMQNNKRSGAFRKEDSFENRKNSRVELQGQETTAAGIRKKIEQVRKERFREFEKKLEQKSQAFTLAIDELFKPQIPIENRIEENRLDSLLRMELRNRGIDLAYGFGILDKSTNHVAMAGGGETSLIMNSDIQVNLFPNDLTGPAHTLSVYFPGQEKYLFNKILLSSISSAALALVIILCFSAALYVIIRQKKLSEIKNDFINNMTHEFKTPISTVSLACEALQDPDVRKEEGFMLRYLGVIKDENHRLSRQVEKVLQAATLEKKDFKLKYEKVDLHQIIEKALPNIRLMVEKKGGWINKNLQAKKPELVSDQVHLTNIIYNLLDNANKYSPEAPEITIESKDAGEGVAFSIIDKGIGMNKEISKRIFEKFYRAPTGNLHDVKGFGLGLTYVKTMVEALGGEVAVESAPGKGSKFKVYLPYENGKV